MLRVEKIGTPPFTTWLLHEEPLSTPYRKEKGYDFDEHERANIRRRFHQNNTLIEIVELKANGRIVGILDTELQEWNNTAWIWNIMLDHDVRGKGLGRRLIERAIEWSKSKQVRAIILETQSNNTPACHFYAHMNFELIGVNEAHYTNNDIERKEFALFWIYRL